MTGVDTAWRAPYREHMSRRGRHYAKSSLDLCPAQQNVTGEGSGKAEGGIRGALR
jgi:hypothetical protein